MVYVPKEELGYEPYFNTWRDRKWGKPEDFEDFGGLEQAAVAAEPVGEDGQPEEEDDDAIVMEYIDNLYQKYIPSLVDYIYEGKTQEEQ